MSGETSTHEVETIQCHSRFEGFTDISEADLAKLISKRNSKSCGLDPLPTKILKECLPQLSPTLTKIVNKSLSESKVPKEIKTADVTPLLKKQTLDKENMKNFRPVSNLPFAGKLIERVAINQMEEYITANNLVEPLQSAYKAHHSTETALLKVQSDILLALDQRKCVYLVLLDLSAAFDTVDHKVFLQQLKQEYGFEHNALDWMASYLTDREQHVTIDSTPSDAVKLAYGFPQGSCIGPFGFKLYTRPLTAIAHKHEINVHLYADDTQLYISFPPHMSEQAMERLERCIEEIRQWMRGHYLKLNDSKTEFLIIGAPKDVEKVSRRTVTVGDSKIAPSKSARNIGAYMDTALDMKEQIANTVRACYLQLRTISKIRKYLTVSSAEKLCHAFITSRIDNLNSLLYKIPDYLLEKLKLIQHNTARLILKLKKHDHITPALIELHWLPIPDRIRYKILLLVYKALHDEGPKYLAEMLIPYQPARALRSNEKELLTERKLHKSYGERAFAAAGPHLWNSLPLSISKSNSTAIFKSRLKTYLFKCAY